MCDIIEIDACHVLLGGRGNMMWTPRIKDVTTSTYSSGKDGKLC